MPSGTGYQGVPWTGSDPHRNAGWRAAGALRIATSIASRDGLQLGYCPCSLLATGYWERHGDLFVQLMPLTLLINRFPVVASKTSTPLRYVSGRWEPDGERANPPLRTKLPLIGPVNST